MAAPSEKTIQRYRYCTRRQEKKDFGEYTWQNIQQNYKFYSLVENADTFQRQTTLYLLEDGASECGPLHRTGYLLNVANAMAFFGEIFIIRELNYYCQKNINEPAIGQLPAYNAPQFRKWKDVTDYVGDRENPRIPCWKQDKKKQVFLQLSVIAQKHGISAHNWAMLTTLYLNRNEACHREANPADAESMKDYAESIPNQNEKESVICLYQKIIKAFSTRRRNRWS